MKKIPPISGSGRKACQSFIYKRLIMVKLEPAKSREIFSKINMANVDGDLSTNIFLPKVIEHGADKDG